MATITAPIMVMTGFSSMKISEKVKIKINTHLLSEGAKKLLASPMGWHVRIKHGSPAICGGGVYYKVTKGSYSLISLNGKG